MPRQSALVAAVIGTTAGFMLAYQNSAGAGVFASKSPADYSRSQNGHITVDVENRRQKWMVSMAA